MPVRFRVDRDLIIPFGCPKWDINKIKVSAVSTNATYFESETPCAYIDTVKEEPMRLMSFTDVFPNTFPDDIHDTEDSLKYMRDFLKEHCELGTKFERDFLDIYFEYCWFQVKPSPSELRTSKKREELPKPRNDRDWVFESLMPLPQAHLYLADPLQERHTFVPSDMVKVDFAFWTGKQIVAVEIDGPSHYGNPQHVRKDRLLQRAGVQVIHIMNDEIAEFGVKVIYNLLPRNICFYWESSAAEYPYNPFGVPF